jgi:hypothetical protein
MELIALTLMNCSTSDNVQQLGMKALSVIDIPATHPPFILPNKQEIQPPLSNATKKAYLDYDKCHVFEKIFRASSSLN